MGTMETYSVYSMYCIGTISTHCYCGTGAIGYVGRYVNSLQSPAIIMVIGICDFCALSFTEWLNVQQSVQLPFAVLPLLFFNCNPRVMGEFRLGKKWEAFFWLASFTVIGINVYLTIQFITDIDLADAGKYRFGLCLCCKHIILCFSTIIVSEKHIMCRGRDLWSMALCAIYSMLSLLLLVYCGFCAWLYVLHSIPNAISIEYCVHSEFPVFCSFQNGGLLSTAKQQIFKERRRIYRHRIIPMISRELTV